VVRAVFQQYLDYDFATIEVQVPEGWRLWGFRLPVDHGARFPILELVKDG
jgi:hypothetical protein